MGFTWNKNFTFVKSHNYLLLSAGMYIELQRYFFLQEPSFLLK